MKLSIRKPPALNRLYGRNHFGSVYLKPEGTVWKEECCYLIKTQCEPELTGDVSLDVVLYTSKHQDIDGIFKILFDSIQASEIIEDDYQIVKLTAKKIRCKKAEEKIEFELLPCQKEE